MKKLLILSLLIMSGAVSFAQLPGSDQCPPGAWCHPGGIPLGNTPPQTNDMLDRMTDAADAAGKNMNDIAANSGCTEESWNPSCMFAEWLPCMYGEGTPQASMCRGNDPEPEPSPNPGGDPPPPPPPPTEETPQSELYYANPGFTPMYFSNGKAKSGVQAYFNKKKRGQIVHRWKEGYTLQLVSKFYRSESHKEYLVLLQMKNKKGQIVGNPIMFTKGNTVYVHDIVSKKKKKKRLRRK